jgi:hypothetical protein
MKITQSWKRNEPDTVTGYSITYTIVYSSLSKEEIDAQEDHLENVIPKGSVVVMDTN